MRQIGYITTESISRLERGGNDSRGTVPIHREESRGACAPVYLVAQDEVPVSMALLKALLDPEYAVSLAALEEVRELVNQHGA